MAEGPPRVQRTCLSFRLAAEAHERKRWHATPADPKPKVAEVPACYARLLHRTPKFPNWPQLTCGGILSQERLVTLGRALGLDEDEDARSCAKVAHGPPTSLTC